MNNFRQELYQEDIARCRRLYAGFNDIESFLEKTFKEIFLFLEENKEKEGVLEEVRVQKKKAPSLFKKGEGFGINPSVQKETFFNLLTRLGKVVTKTNPEFKKAIKDFQSFLEDYKGNFGERISKQEIWELRDILVDSKVLAQDMATFIFSLAISGIFRFYLVDITKGLGTDHWEGGECALCGEKPHFGMLRSEDGAKILECWLCGIQWIHTRIKCPFCSNTEQEELGFFTVEDKDLCRVHFCNKCGCYYKVFDTRKIPGEDIVLPIHNLASLSYDYLAKEEGFSPGSGLEWVNKEEKIETED